VKWKGIWKKRPGPNSRYYPGICLGTEKLQSG
jgi:hypothetical protein